MRFPSWFRLTEAEEDPPKEEGGPEPPSVDPEEELAEFAKLLEGELEELCLEAFEMVPTDKTGKVWGVIIIREGPSINGKYYMPSALRESSSLWEGQDICEYGWFPNGGAPAGHVPAPIEKGFPKGTYSNQVGILKNVRERHRAGRLELIAEAHITCPRFREKTLANYQARGTPPGLSIHAYGRPVMELREGRRMPTVHRIHRTKELTVVSRASAGGGFETLVAGDITEIPKESSDVNKLKKLRAFAARKDPSSLTTLVEAYDEKALIGNVVTTLLEMDNGAIKTLATLGLKFLKAEKYDEAIDVLETALQQVEGSAPEVSPTTAAATYDPLLYEAQQAKLKESLDEIAAAKKDFLDTVSANRCQDLLERKLKESALPDVVAKGLREDFGEKVFLEADLDKHIDRAKNILAEVGGGQALLESAALKRSRDPRFEIVCDSLDKVQMAMDLGFDYDYEQAFKEGDIDEATRGQYKALGRSPRNYSPLNTYLGCTGDWERSGKVQQDSLLEGVNSLSYPEMLGKSMTKKLWQQFQQEHAPEWGDIAQEVDLDTLKQQDRIIVGSLEGFPQVAEGAPYLDLGNPQEFKTAYDLIKHGGLFKLTEESIYKDDLAYFKSIPEAIKDAGIFTRDRFGWDLVTGYTGSGLNSAPSYDGVAHYHPNHRNYSTDAIDHAAIIASDVRLSNTMKISFITALNDATGVNTSDAEFVVDDLNGIQVGCVIRIDAEFVQVTAINTGTKTLTVTRGYMGSTPASHADNAGVFVHGGVLSMNKYRKILVVPNEKYPQALVALTSEHIPGNGNNDINILKTEYQEGTIKLVRVNALYLRSTTRWYQCVPWKVCKGIEFGYFQGKRAPEVVVQNAPTVGENFTNDIITYRGKFRIGGRAHSHEGRDGNLATA